LATAIKSVEGVKVVTAPAKGSGEHGLSLAVVELGGKSTLSAVTTAVEKAKTPHAEKSPPAVVGVIPHKVKPGTTPEDLYNALKKAGLLEE
jgi:hypothetical protein